MSRIEPGTSDTRVRDLQINLNTLLGGNKVKVTGTYDEATQAALDEVAGKLKLKGATSGALDAAMIKAIEEAAEPRLEVRIQGKTYFVTQAEYQKAMLVAQKKAREVARPFIAFANYVMGYHQAHERVREQAKGWVTLMEFETGAEWPKPAKVKAAVEAARQIEAAAAALEIDEARFRQMAKPLRDLCNDLDSYVTTSTIMGPKMVSIIDNVAQGSVVAMKILGEFASAGRGKAAAVPIAAAVGAYEGLIGALTSENAGHASLGEMMGTVVKGAVVEGVVKAVMKGKGGAGGLGGALDKAVEESIKKAGSTTLTTYAHKAANSAAQKVIEETIKAAFGAGDLSRAKTPEQLQTALVETYLNGLAMGKLGAVAKKYQRGFYAPLKPVLERLQGGRKAMVAGIEDGIKKAVEEAGTRQYTKFIEEAEPKENLNVDAIEKKMIDAIVNDPKVQKAMKEGAKGAGSR